MRKSATSVGDAVVHTQKAGLHWGAGALLGKNAFRVVQKGLDIRHHAKMTELPFGNDNVKLYGIGFDWSKRF